MINKELLIDAKIKATKLKQFIETTHKKNKIKANKKYKTTLKSINDFLKCNLTDKSIYSKYEKMRTELGQ